MSDFLVLLGNLCIMEHIGSPERYTLPLLKPYLYRPIPVNYLHQLGSGMGCTHPYFMHYHIIQQHRHSIYSLCETILIS